MPDARNLPDGVRLLKRGEPRYFTQRVTAPPMADCMFAALCTPLSFMGLELPPDFIRRLRAASGRPRENEKGKPQGSTTKDSQIAIRKLFGELPGLKFGGLDDEDMLERIAAKEIVVRVIVSNQKLPEHIRRWVGKKWDGLHAVAIGAAERPNGGDGWKVFWMDPAGRPGHPYGGEFVAYADVRDALKRLKSGKVRVTYGERDAALGPSQQSGGPTNGTTDGPKDPPADQTGGSTIGGSAVKLLTHATPNEFARVPKGTVFLHPETMRRVTKAAAEGDFRLAGRSQDGNFAGVWVKTSQVPGATGLTLLLVDVTEIGKPFVPAA